MKFNRNKVACPKCNCWLEFTIADGIGAPSYAYCPNCEYSEIPMWTLNN